MDRNEIYYFSSTDPSTKNQVSILLHLLLSINCTFPFQKKMNEQYNFWSTNRTRWNTLLTTTTSLHEYSHVSRKDHANSTLGAAPMEIAWVPENYSVWVKSVECDGHAPVKTSLVQEVWVKPLRNGCGHHAEVACQLIRSKSPCLKLTSRARSFQHVLYLETLIHQ